MGGGYGWMRTKGWSNSSVSFVDLSAMCRPVWATRCMDIAPTVALGWMEGKRMINAKGETIYTSAEIAYELGISPATVSAVGKRLFGGGRIPHWTLNDARLICEYVKSSVEEDAKRLAILHDAVKDIFGDTKLDDVETKRRVNNDIHLAGRW